jgi:PBP1b-binding outer membrane lipoprotein LpoB
MKIYYVLIWLAAFLLIGCNSNQTAAGSPSDVLKQYVAASQKQDIAAMKSLLSKSSLRYIEEKARPMRLTVDDVLKKETEVKLQSAVETRNEKIEGETATVEVKNPATGEFDVKYPFVKENGAWKLARDRYIEEEMKKASEEVNKKLANSALSNTNSSVNATTNK